MARRPRLVVAGLPVHLLWRGNAGACIFLDAQDAQALIASLAAAASRFGVQVHAYVLMPNHVHLVATPSDVTGLASTLQALGRDYVRAFNRRHGRTGTLWEGRFRSSLIEPGPWVLRLLRYVELNPVRAGLVDQAMDYEWSSHRALASGAALTMTHAAPEYWALGNTPFEREERWRNWCNSAMADEELVIIRRNAHGGWPIGTNEFVARLEATHGQRQHRARAGRPRKMPAPTPP